MLRRTTPFLLCTLLAGCEGTTPLNVYDVAATSGDAQTDTVTRVLPVPLVATVRGETGNPVAGASVQWVVQSGGGSVAATTVTDASGQVSASWTLGPVAGAQTVRAAAGGGNATFTATALPDAPTQSSKNAGDQQINVPSATLPVPYAVLVQDQHGNPVPGVTVNWTAAAGQGSVSAPTSVTGAGGVATIVHTLGPNLGPDSVLATVSALNDSLTFVSRGVGQPVLVATVPIPPFYGIHDTFVRDGIAFVCAWNTGVMIFDVGNGVSSGSPASPQLIHTIPTAGGEDHNAWWFWNGSEKKYLFVGQEGAGQVGLSSSGDIHVVDVSNLASPVEVGSFTLGPLPSAARVRTTSGWTRPIRFCTRPTTTPASSH